MAELDIKPDPDGPLGNMTPIQIEADSSSLFVNEDTPMPPSDPAWKICGHESIERRVKIKEDAVASCILIMKKPREQLEALDLHGKEYPELQEWFRKSDEIINRKEKSRILVGFLGGTGTGKTSLVNAILKTPRLLPSSCSRAATAVVTQISWNHDNDPEKEYKAEVYYMSKKAWEDEVRVFYRDVKESVLAESCSDDLHEDDEEAAVAEEERKARIGNTMDKITSVYPHLSEEAIKSMSANQLLADESVSRVLSTIRIIHGTSSAEFGRELKPFVDSTISKDITGTGRSFAHWPLVQLVKVYVKSPILKCGLVLVDLPGSFDTNQARSSVAEKYQEQLSVICVVAPIDRAADDQGAKTILSKERERQLKLDGNFIGSRYSIIMTKIDHMPIDIFLDEHPEATPAVQDLKAELEKIEVRIGEIKVQLAVDNPEKMAIEKRLDSITRNIRRLEQRGVPLMTKSRTRDKLGVEKLSPDQVIERIKSEKQRSGDNKNQLKVLRDRIRRIETEDLIIKNRKVDIESQIRAICIELRNETSKTRLKKDFLHKRQYAKEVRGSQYKKNSAAATTAAADDDLNVFCVSADASFGIEKGTVSGFPTQESTGILQLQDWLEKCTLAKREAEADSFLQEQMSLIDSMERWAYEMPIQQKLSREEKTQVMSIAASEFESLREILMEPKDAVLAACNGSIKTKIKKAFLEGGERARDTCFRTVAQFPVRTYRNGKAVMLPWATYKAICIRDGIHTSQSTIYGEQIFNWNEQLAGDLTEAILPEWESIFRRQMPHLFDLLGKSVDTVFGEFVEGFIKKIETACPAIRGPVKRLEPNYERLGIQLNATLRGILEDLNNATRHIHRQIPRLIIEQMKPAYTNCKGEKGPGILVKLKGHMVAHIKNIRRPMYKTCANNLYISLTDEFKAIGTKIDAAVEEVVAQARIEFTSTLEKNSIAGEDASAHDIERPGMKQQKDIITAAIAGLHEKWVQGLPAEEDVDEEMVDCSGEEAGEEAGGLAREDDDDFCSNYSEDDYEN